MARAKNRAAEGLTKLTVDSPIPYTLSDLSNAIQNEMGLLNKATDTAPYMRLKTKIDELKADPRYSFMFSGMLVADSMTTFISKIFRLPAKGKPISIVDVSGVPSDITSVVVAVLSRLVFDYAIWSRNELQRPVLLVCEEAHRYVPSDKTSPARRCARSSSGSPRKAVSTASRWASSRSARRTSPKACSRSAAPSSACASTTSAISSS
jgi:hypothetical protein